jgi:hypothetical protein
MGGFVASYSKSWEVFVNVGELFEEWGIRLSSLAAAAWHSPIPRYFAPVVIRISMPINKVYHQVMLFLLLLGRA